MNSARRTLSTRPIPQNYASPDSIVAAALPWAAVAITYWLLSEWSIAELRRYHFTASAWAYRRSVGGFVGKCFPFVHGEVVYRKP
jgi:hypothetical protein